MPILPIECDLLTVAFDELRVVLDSYLYWPENEQERLSYISRCLSEQMAIVPFQSEQYQLLHKRRLMIGGFKTLNQAKSKQEYENELSVGNVYGDLTLVSDVLLTLARLYFHHSEYEPSLNKAMHLVCANSPNKFMGHRVKSSHTRIEYAWRTYKPVVHIIAATAISEPKATNTQSILTFVKISNELADFLTSFRAVRQKKPYIEQTEQWRFKEMEVGEKFSFLERLSPLGEESLDILRDYKSVNRKQ